MKFEFLILSMHAVRGLGSLKRQESPWVAMRCVMISRSLVKRTVPKCNPARRACYDMLCQNFSAERFAAFVDVTMLGHQRLDGESFETEAVASAAAGAATARQADDLTTSKV